jgi:hypothetical protein
MIVHARENSLDPFLYVSKLFPVDCNELYGKAAIAAIRVLTNEAVPMEPADQGGLVDDVRS